MKSVADIIIQHIEPMKNDDIEPIHVDMEEAIVRYMKFKERYDFDTVDIYKLLSKLYMKEIRIHEKKLGISYRIWSDEVMREFENNFSNMYVRPFVK